MRCKLTTNLSDTYPLKRGFFILMNAFTFKKPITTVSIDNLKLKRLSFFLTA